MSIESHDAARRAYRRYSRRVSASPQDVGAHLARVHEALAMEGVEPLQGSLADLFTTSDVPALKSAALELAGSRLAHHVRQRFAAWTQRARLPRVTPLATRWSVLAVPSAAVSTRVRRCSVDDSQAMALQAVAAVEQNDLAVQEQFLHHCLTCRDALAFMLARRSLLKRYGELPAAWVEVGHSLEGRSA